MTAFLGNVFPFLTANDLVVCMQVCKIWKEEANALSLWRALLADNPSTVMYTYCGLTVDAIQKILLWGHRPFLVKQDHGESMPVFSNGTFARPFLTSSDAEARMPLDIQITNGVVAQSFSSGTAFVRREHNKLSVPMLQTRTAQLAMNKALASALMTMETLQAHMVLLKRQIADTTRVLDALYQHLPSSDAVWLYHECTRQWKRLLFFEELVLTLLCSNLKGPSFRVGVRSFVQAEIATHGETDLSFSLQWCRFKKVFSLDDHYYNYVDWLYSYGPGKENFFKMSLDEEEIGKWQMERFSALCNLIEDVTKQRYGHARENTWECFLQYLENKNNLGRETTC